MSVLIASNGEVGKESDISKVSKAVIAKVKFSDNLSVNESVDIQFIAFDASKDIMSDKNMKLVFEGVTCKKLNLNNTNVLHLISGSSDQLNVINFFDCMVIDWKSNENAVFVGDPPIPISVTVLDSDTNEPVENPSVTR